MEPFKTHTGIVAPLERENVDTDAILPKQFLKRTEKTGYGQYLFYDWRFIEENNEHPDFVLNKPVYRGSTILLTGKNFGCGSSREHAPWALADFGFRVIIAPSFADIFYNNCFKNGILPIILTENEVQHLFTKASEIKAYQLTVNLEAKKVFDQSNFSVSFEVDDYRHKMLLEGFDEIASTLIYESSTEEFEKSHKVFYQL